MTEFLKKAFHDMKESTHEQHEADKAAFAAAKAESKARWEEAKAMGRLGTCKAMMKAERKEQMREANERRAAAEACIKAAQSRE